MNKLLELCNIYKKQIIVSLLAVTLITLGVIYILINRVKASSDVALEPQVIEEEKEEEKLDTVNTIKINVKGAVINPGVYELVEGDRVVDAIEKSGGLSKNADTSLLNLSKILRDEDVIIIYTKDEVKKIKAGGITTQQIEKECNCPYIENNACINENNIAGKNNSNNITDEKISINTATKEQLQTLSGIGASKADDIIEYRNINGKYEKIEDILNVKGIGQALFENIKDNITV